MRIRSKLLLNAVIVFLSLSMVGGIGTIATTHVANISMQLVENEAIPISKINALENSVWGIWQRLTLHTRVSEVETMQQLELEIGQLEVEIPKQVKAIEVVYAVEGVGANAHLKTLQTFQTEWQQFHTIAKQVLQLSHDFTKEDALHLILQGGQTSYNKVILLLRQLVDDHSRDMATLRDAALAAKQQATMTIITLTLVIGLSVLFLINRFGRHLLTPLLLINSQLKLLAQGQLVAEELEYQGTDEVAEIVSSARLLKESMKSTIAQANAIAAGNYSKEVALLSEQDQLGRALSEMTHTLDEVTKQNAIQDWLKTGQTQLHDQMSGDQTLVDLANNIISFLTLYVEAQVGLFYGVEKSVNSPQLRVKLLASYAYTRRKNLAEEFAFSEGLVERAAREQKCIRLTINTVLGEGIPSQVFLMPFLHENVIKGVIQLGSAEPLTDIQQEFLQQVMANIGIAVNSIEARTKMQELLQQTQIQAEALQSQKDELQYQKAELQQQKEELQSQTEELQSQSEELQSQTEELRHANEEMEERTKELEQQKEEGRQKNLMLEKTQQAMQLKAEEVERASKYKSEFLANMSHELRTPLNSMLILAQLLAENKAGNLEDKQVEYARTIHSAGADLLTLINEILDLSKVEAGKIEVQAEDVSLRELTESIEQKFRPIAAEKGLTFALTVAPEVPQVLNTDAQRLKQILNNLLSNAFKFTAQGEVKLTITKPGSQHFSFVVTDTGIGIPKDKQGLIFEAFQQADGSTSRRFGGTGLGLSISRQLARLLGGDIHLQSEEGQGSTFTLSLPESLSKQPENLPQQTSFEAEPSRLPLKEMTIPLVSDLVSPPVVDDRDHLRPADKTILVIEDDRNFSTILMELAREQGFKCLLAEDGRTGLQVAEQYQPQAIILDVGLPKLNGWNVMEKLKENSKTRHIPVHFMSAADQSQDAKQMGAIGYLLKPVSIGQLSEAFTRIEQFIAKTMKNLLVVVDDSQRQGKILELVGSEGIETTRAFTKKDALRQLHTTPFDCIILDVDTEQASGLKLLEELREEEDLLRVPVIIYAERDLTVAEEDLLKLCADKLTVKAVKSPERLLEEATLFLHQVETHLPKDKRQMLQMMHDKESILRDKKVLIVDDDTRNTFALVTVLEDKDLVAIAGKNGREALELLEEHSDIDIVLMDIMMPEMDGYEAIRQIRAQPRFRKLPIIALTAKAMKGDKAKCIEAGANDYLSKPIDNDKLLSLMRVWLYR